VGPASIQIDFSPLPAERRIAGRKIIVCTRRPDIISVKLMDSNKLPWSLFEVTQQKPQTAPCSYTCLFVLLYSCTTTASCRAA